MGHAQQETADAGGACRGRKSRERRTGKQLDGSRKRQVNTDRKRNGGREDGTVGKSGEYGECEVRERERELVGRNCGNIVGEGTILYGEGVAVREGRSRGCCGK